MRATNNNWALVSTYTLTSSNQTNVKAFDNEIFQVATDGSGRVRRIAHHRSNWNEYNDQPQADINRDGRFVSFRSTVGQRQRPPGRLH